MNRNDNSSSTPSSSSAPLDALEAPTFSASVAPVAFPRFPTVEEILEHQAGKALHPLLQLGEAPPSRPQSMFEGMLGSRLDVLLDDVARQPDAYDAAARGLLEELAAGTKKLADLGKEDRHALDRATVDFASYKPPPSFATSWRLTR